MNNLAAAIYMTAQGIPFIHAGEEFLREKLDENNNRVENSYNSPDYVNQIRWNMLDHDEYRDVIDYYRGLIAFRKAHPAMRLETADAVAENVTYHWITNEVVLFSINGKSAVADEPAEQIIVVFNATNEAKTIDLSIVQTNKEPWNVCIDGEKSGTAVIKMVSENIVEVAPISAMVLVK
jgi:pullulanase